MPHTDATWILAFFVFEEMAPYPACRRHEIIHLVHISGVLVLFILFFLTLWNSLDPPSRNRCRSRFIYYIKKRIRNTTRLNSSTLVKLFPLSVTNSNIPPLQWYRIRKLLISHGPLIIRRKHIPCTIYI